MEPKQVKFIADADVYGHLQKQDSIKAYLHRLIRADMGAASDVEKRLTNLEDAIGRLVLSVQERTLKRSKAK